MEGRLRLIFLGVVLLLVVPFFGATAANAHTGNQSYVYLEVFDTAIAGRVEYPINDLNRILGLDIPVDESGTLEALEENADVIQAYTAEHFAIGPADGLSTWPYEFEDVELLDLGGGSYAVFNFEIQERFDPPPRTFTVSYDAIIEADSDRDGFLLIATDWGSGTFNNESNEFLRFSQGDTTHLVELDDTSWFKGMSGVIELGAEHIRIGTDHILFVLALVLPSVLVFVKWRDEEQRWHPSPSFGSSLWRVLKIVTMFTIAHSITLALGGLGIVELSPAWSRRSSPCRSRRPPSTTSDPSSSTRSGCWRSPSGCSTGSVSPGCCRSSDSIAATGSPRCSASTSASNWARPRSSS